MGASPPDTRTCALAAAIAAAALAGTAAAQVPMRDMHEVLSIPDDCRSVIAPGQRGTVQPWQAYVWLEHCDRVKRLQRLSLLLPPDQQPRFYEGVVPRDRLPAEFATDVPVLRVVFPERTFFDTAEARLLPEAEQVTAIIAESLRREPPDVALFVAGHADARGENAFNERLSIDRADSIARTIYRAGVNLSSIWRIGFGEDMPLVPGNTAYAWDRNRRVEFLFAARPEAVASWLAYQQADQLCQARDTLEVRRCKERLDFRDGYDAVEVGVPPRRRIDAPAVRPPRAVDPSAGRSAVAPSPGKGRSVDPRAIALTGVTPEAPRKIRIDPRPSSVERVKLNL